MKLSAPFWSFERTETSFFKLHHGEISLRLAPTVAPLTTVALVMPGAVAQPADPRTMVPFAPVMIPLASQLACAALPKASKAIVSITARTAAGMTAATSPASAVLASRRDLGFMRPAMVASPNVTTTRGRA
jgi:hypothetical protein